VNLSRYT